MSAAHRVLSQTLGEIKLRYKIVVTTAGAVAGVVPLRNDGFDVITSQGSGVYTLTFLNGRGYPELLENHSYVMQAATYSATAARFMRVSTDNVAGAVPSIVFTVTNSAGTPVQPLIGDTLIINVIIRR